MKTEILKYKNNNIAFLLSDGDIKVNVTDFAKAFPKKNLSHIINSAEIQDYVKEIAEIHNCSSADLLEVRKGGNNKQNQGTWAHRRVALRIAQKLSTKFAVAVDVFLEELLTKGTVSLFKPIGGVYPIVRNGVVGYPRRELLIASGYSPNSGMVGKLKKRFPEHFFSIARTACLSPGFAELRYQQGKVRQLELNFTNTHKTRVLDNQFVNSL